MTFTVVVGKTGGVMRTRDRMKTGSAAGEQGETEGLVRHLCKLPNIRVIYFGNVVGELPCEVITPYREGLLDCMGEPSDGKAQRICWEMDIDMIAPYEPKAVINVAGYSPTWSTIDNPNGAIIQANSVLYTAPLLNLCERFKIPRIVINNDMRTYPKDQEMSLCSPWWRPAALLDQWTHDATQVVGGVKYERRSVHAYCESWGHLMEAPDDNPSHREPAVVVAHAHIGDGFKERGREKAWEHILCDQPLPLDSDGVLDVYGKGWDYFSGKDRAALAGARFRGPCTPIEVDPILRRALCCPCVAGAPGFNTGKAWVLVASGVVPLPYGDGRDDQPYTYDPTGRLLSLTDPSRLRTRGDFACIARTLQREPSTYHELLTQWRRKCVPDWSVLDRLVGDLSNGRPIDDAGWWRDYGGYRRASSGVAARRA